MKKTLLVAALAVVLDMIAVHAQQQPPREQPSATEDAVATGGTFPLAAKAGQNSNAKNVAPSGAVNQGPFDMTKWKYGTAWNAPAAYAGDAKGDAANGKELFMANGCPACHGVTEEDNSKVGPNLVGVVGRKAGTTQSLLGPSENLKKYGVIWSAETLDEFLANPNAKVPGTAMAGILTDPQQRADVIAYLSTLKN